MPLLLPATCSHLIVHSCTGLSFSCQEHSWDLSYAQVFCWLSAKEKVSSGLCKAKEWGGGKNTTDFYFRCTHLVVKNSVSGTENQLKGRFVREHLLLTVSCVITPQSWSSRACCSTWDREMSLWKPKGVWVMEVSLLMSNPKPLCGKATVCNPHSKAGPLGWFLF